MIRITHAIASIFVVSALVWSTTAAGQEACAVPAAPSPITVALVSPPILPERPACAERNRCRAADVDTYNAQIERYNAALFDYEERQNQEVARANAYSSALSRYASDVDAYLTCERRRVTEAINSNR